jgi:hypothetical protein
MAAKILYSKGGSDPTTLVWPDKGPWWERWSFTSGTALLIQDLIGYGDGSITFADGRQFPPVTVQGSTLKHQKN